jgi:hypothetical protein
VFTEVFSRGKNGNPGVKKRQGAGKEIFFINR